MATISQFINVSSEDSRMHPIDILNRNYSETLLPLSILFGLLSVFGCFGNIVVLIVFSRSKAYTNSIFRMFALYLAGNDLAMCLTVIPLHIVRQRMPFSFPDPNLCKVVCFLNTFSTSASANTLLVICIDRYRRVCRPFGVQIRPCLALKLLGIVTLVSFVLTIPSPIMCGVTTRNITVEYFNNTIPVTVCASEKRFEKTLLRFAYKSTMTVCLIAISLTLIILYFLIGKAVVKATRSHINKPSTESPEHLKLKIFSKTPGFYRERCDVLATLQQNGASRSSESVHSLASRSHDHFCSEENGARMKTESVTSRHNDDLRRNTDKGHRHPQKTLIWFTVTMVFIVTYFLYASLSFIPVQSYSQLPEVYLAVKFFYRLYFINNFINPLIYLLLDDRFRNSCKKLLLRV